MVRIPQYVTWLTVIFLIVAVMHVYFWWRLIAATEPPQSWRLPLTIILIVLAVSMPAPFFANRYFSYPWREGVLWVGYIWMGLAFLLFVGLLASEIPRLLLWVFGPSDPHWRLFMSRTVTFVATGVVLCAGAYSIWNAARDPEFRSVRVTLDRLPPGLSGLTIVQISDVHVGGLVRKPSSGSCSKSERASSGYRRDHGGSF